MTMDEMMRHIVKINRQGGERGESLDAQENLGPKRDHNKESEYGDQLTEKNEDGYV